MKGTNAVPHQADYLPDRNMPLTQPELWGRGRRSRDYGPNPFVVNIEHATLDNRNIRTALWTGKYLQLTLMSIGVGDEIGLERHPHTDQFLRIEQGVGQVLMGANRNSLVFRRRVGPGDAIFVPAGTWHNLINIGNRPLKLYSIYAPPEHPRGTVHVTRAEAEREHY